MQKNTKQAYQLLLIAMGFVTLGAWLPGIVGRADVVWGLRIGTPMAAAAVAWLFYRGLHRPEKLPDLLGQTVGKYFERDGLCFAPVVETVDGASRLSIYFQNRHAGHASATIHMLPPRRSFRFGRHPLPPVQVLIECPAAAFGVARLPFPIPPKYQGRRMSFELAADVRYPARRGRLLRFRAGKRTGRGRDLERG